jgi:calreticulin
MKFVLSLLAIVLCVEATTFFQEGFGSGWENRWVKSTFKGDEAGELVSHDGGVKTGTDARFYQYSASFTPFSNKGKDLVFQFSVAHPQGIDCGGGYFKLLPKGFDQSKFNGDVAYDVMFGPDICGGTKRVHAIITHKGKNHLIRKDINAPSDKFTHVFTLVIKADHKTFEVLVDNVSERTGLITDEWDILPPKKIPDPNAKKPADWVDEPKMDDPTDKKPAGYDDIPAQIPDPEAKKPEDWDDDLDGKWTAPLIDNPEYKGEWKARQIDNPAYKGPWVHPQIDNPDFKEDDTIANFENIGGVGLEIWQVKAGTVFDNILVTDSLEEAKAAAEKILEKQKQEKAEDEKKQAEERKAAEEAAEKAKAEAASNKGEQEAEAKDEL